MSKYKDSETRLVEVLEGVCSKSDFECHRLLELSEELVESWWFHNLSWGYREALWRLRAVRRGRDTRGQRAL